MASPTAVAGRRPDGALRKTQLHLNASTLRPVEPLMLGSYLLRNVPAGERVAVVKIDTEGFESH
eukprot:6090757-Prymnesium_polylepis.1